MSLVVRGEELGFYKLRTHDVVPIEGCPIVLPQLDEEIGRLNRAASNPATSQAIKESRHIVARAARNGSQPVVAFSTALRSRAVSGAAGTLLHDLNAKGIVNSFAPASENAVLGRQADVVAGEGEVEEVIGRLRFRVSATSFFQVNTEIVERIYDRLRDAFAGLGSVVDLYCGAGTFSVLFAHVGNTVLGIDQSAEAVREARRNATLNGVEEAARFEAGAVETVVARSDIRAELVRAKAVFLDPPRKGSDERTLSVLAACEVPAIWYLSCDPATLARDLKFLAANAYALQSAVPFDMFPQTGHVETLAQLTRKDAGSR